MTATGLTLELLENMIEAHRYVADIQEARSINTDTRPAIHVLCAFNKDGGHEQVRILVQEEDRSAVLSLLHDRATARLAALQDEARKALGVPCFGVDFNDSPSMLGVSLVPEKRALESTKKEESIVGRARLDPAPTFKKGDRVRVLSSPSTVGDVLAVLDYSDSVPVHLGSGLTGVFFNYDIELIPSPLSGDFISEADDARLVRVGKGVFARGNKFGPDGDENDIGTLIGPHIKVCHVGNGGESSTENSWEGAYNDHGLTPDARLTLRTAELTLTADERAKVEAGE